MLDLKPASCRARLEIGRPDLTPVPELTLHRVVHAGAAVTVRVANGIGDVVSDPN